MPDTTGLAPRMRSSVLAAMQWRPEHRSWGAVFKCSLLQTHFPGLVRPSLFPSEAPSDVTAASSSALPGRTIAPEDDTRQPDGSGRKSGDGLGPKSDGLGPKSGDGLGPKGDRPGPKSGDELGPDLVIGHCSCSGNCGSPAHKARQRLSGRICKALAVRGYTFCARCKCEVPECDRARQLSFGLRRWCRRHRSEIGEIDQGIQYWTARGGVQDLNPSWPPPFKLAARLSHLLSLPTTQPADLEQLLGFLTSSISESLERQWTPESSCAFSGRMQ